MKLVFFGEDSFSSIVLESLLNNQHEIVGVFCPVYHNKIFYRLKLVCEKFNISFFRVEDINSEFVETQIQFFTPELIVVCHFQKLLKRNIINIPFLGCINLHPSLLPNYRGMSPQHWPIINGDTETGITIHFINEGVDTGDIILQEKIKITDNMYVVDLQMKMMKLYGDIMVRAINEISNVNTIFIKQDLFKGSYYGRLKESQCKIDIDKGIDKIYNLIRGVSMPYFGAYFLGYRIWRARKADFIFTKKVKYIFNELGIHLGTEFGDFINFRDGVLIIEKYNLL
jgi:methionyl-tRNA formyltransferase